MKLKAIKQIEGVERNTEISLARVYKRTRYFVENTERRIKKKNDLNDKI